MRNNIKAIRKISNISQQVIADALGVTITAVNKWENNVNIKIPDKRIKEIADLLGVSEQDILAEDLDIEKIRLQAVQEQLQRLQQSGYVTVDFVKGEDTNEEEYEAINDRFKWKQSMYPVIESFVKGNFSKVLSKQEQFILGKNIALYLDEDSYKLEFLQRVVQFLTDSDAQNDADLAALYEKNRQKNLSE